MFRALSLAAVLLAAAGSTAAPATPQSAHRRAPYVGAISADAADGHVFRAYSENEEAYPASLSKLMTALLVLEDVAAGRYSLTNMVVATPDVYNSEPSWVGIRVGERMSVRDLMYALMVESANDAAIALGVNSAGSFDAFVAKMNARAAELEMTRTRYYNPNGLPPGRPNGRSRPYPWKNFNVSTAADQLRLALALMKRPEIFEFTSVKTCDLIKTPGGYRVSVTRAVNRPQRETRLERGEKVVKQMRNHNHIMVKDRQKVINPDGSEAVDGFKTGYIDAGGSSVILTGTRKGRRAVVVVLGSMSASLRDEHARQLLVDALGAMVW